jgi:hypothetical protein
LWQLHSLGISTAPEHSRYHSKIATWRDAPELVDPEEVADAKLSTDPATFAREWECNFDSGGGLVYPAFDENFHVKEPPASVRLQRFALGVDHGWEHPRLFTAGFLATGKTRFFGFSTRTLRPIEKTRSGTR